MLADCDGPGHMSLRLVALVLAALLAVPASVALLRPRHTDGGDGVPRRPLDALWAVVPASLLAVLAAFAVAA